MTAQQQALYRAAMRIGRAFALAATWTLYRPTGDGVTGAVTLVAQGSRTLYIVEEKLSVWGQPAPPQPVGFVPFKMVALIGTDVLAGDVVVSGAYAFTIGTLDQYQGFPTAIVTVTGMPVSTTSTAGYRSPLWILGVSA